MQIKVRQKYILNHCLKKGPILETGRLFGSLFSFQGRVPIDISISISNTPTIGVPISEL